MWDSSKTTITEQHKQEAVSSVKTLPLMSVYSASDVRAVWDTTLCKWGIWGVTADIITRDSATQFQGHFCVQKCMWVFMLSACYCCLILTKIGMC
jgi:hypothetical protein